MRWHVGGFFAEGDDAQQDFRCGLLAVMVMARVGVGATVSVIDQLVPKPNGSLTKVREGVEIRTTSGFEGPSFTKDSFSVPLVITAVAKTDSKSLRLYYAKGILSFNPRNNDGNMALEDPKTHASTRFPGQGDVPPNTFVTIVWRIDADKTSVTVDGKLRCEVKGDYAGLSSNVGIGTIGRPVITVKSMTVTSAPPPANGKAPPTKAPPAPAEGEEETFETVDVTVSTTAPELKKGAEEEPAGAAESAVERPAYRHKTKSLVKSLGEVTGLAVRVAADGDERGSTLDIIGTVPADSRAGTDAGAGITMNVGPEMRTCFKEAVKALQLRYPYWEPGHIDVSFGDKYIPHEGGSAGTAFGVLMLSMLEGFEVDPKFAVTGDITVDWKVRPVGGITAKLRGAALDGCVAAAIPEWNEPAFADMRLMYGDASMWNVQVFSIAHLQDAVGLLRVDRDAKVTESMKLFGELAPELTKLPRETLRSSATALTLKKILALTPNCLSAKYLLEMTDGTAARTISSSATIYDVVRILYPYRKLMTSGQDVTPQTLSLVTTANARRQLNALRPIAPAELQAFVNDAMAYVEAVNNVAYSNGPMEVVNTKGQIVNARLAAVSSEQGFMDRLVREGY